MFDNNPRTPVKSGVFPGNTPQIPNAAERKVVRYLDEIFDPDIHNPDDIAKYVIPQEGEIVVDVVNKRFLEVSHVDKHGTWKSTFVPWEIVAEEGDSEYQLFPKHEYGFLQGELALFIDYTVRPPVARVDANAVAPDAAYAILYKGNNIGEAGQVISAQYAGVELINEKIPVSPVVYDNLENKTIMGADSFSVNVNEADMPNGTRATLVYFDVNNRPIPPTYSLATQHCGYLRDHQLTKRYVKSIELISPWFTNSSTPNTLYIPINLALKTVEFRAKVHYSDGTSSEELPVNSYNGNNGFTLNGLNQYKPTTPGQTSNALVLSYAFKESEQAYIVQAGAPRHISERFTIVATPAEGAYSPRIYSYPYWDVNSGWKLKHYLTDLERKYCRDVTAMVTLNEASPAFDGRKYGEEQNLIFNLNMRDVAANYEPWSFVQETSITLYNDATAEGRKWDVRHSYGKPPFVSMTVEFAPQTGGTVKARFANIATVDEFVAKGYLAFEPLLDPRTEVNAPNPTHFDILRTNNTSRTGIPIGEFNKLPIDSLSLVHGEGVYIRWVHREPNGNELQLGVSAAVCKRVDVLA